MGPVQRTHHSNIRPGCRDDHVEEFWPVQKITKWEFQENYYSFNFKNYLFIIDVLNEWLAHSLCTAYFLISWWTAGLMLKAQSIVYLFMQCEHSRDCSKMSNSKGWLEFMYLHCRKNWKRNNGLRKPMCHELSIIHLNL